MKLYLDTSVVSVQILGGYSDLDKQRSADTLNVFKQIDDGRLDAVVSFYVLQELYSVLKPRTTGVSPWVKAFLTDRRSAGGEGALTFLPARP